MCTLLVFLDIGHWRLQTHTAEVPGHIHSCTLNLWRSGEDDDCAERECVTPVGLEPAIPGSVGRCLIHWSTGPCFFAKHYSVGNEHSVCFSLPGILFKFFFHAIHSCARHARFEKLRALMGYRILFSSCLTPGLFYSATSGSPQCHRLHFCLRRRHGVLGPLRPCKAMDQGQANSTLHSLLQSQLGPRRNQICNTVGFASRGSNL